jgi:hypothetical protein
MAASRYAAAATRKLILLQRTQPSVVSCRLVPRSIHTAPPSSSPAAGSENIGTSKAIPPASSPPHGAPTGDKEAKILRFQKELQCKKQELYDLLCEVEDNRYYMPYTWRVIRDRIQNVKLLQNLSMEVARNPLDDKWEFYRKCGVFNFWGLFVASAVITVWAVKVFDKKQDEDPKSENVNAACAEM